MARQSFLVMAGKSPGLDDLKKSLTTDLSSQPNFKQKRYLVCFGNLNDDLTKISPFTSAPEPIEKIWIEINLLTRNFLDLRIWTIFGIIHYLETKDGKKMSTFKLKEFPRFVYSTCQVVSRDAMLYLNNERFGQQLPICCEDC